MSENSLDDILSKLKSGGSLVHAEKKYVQSKLTSYNNSEELEQAIRAFGLSSNANSQNIEAIEQYLNSQSDIVLSGVVKVLCAKSYWGLVETYVLRLKDFLKKEDAFELSETQISVFSVMGEYLNNTSDSDLYKFLYEMFVKELEEYKNDKDYFQKARLERMYHCLDVGIRGRQAELDYRVGRMEIPDDVNEDLMMDVIKVIKKKKKKKQKA